MGKSRAKKLHIYDVNIDEDREPTQADISLMEAGNAWLFRFLNAIRRERVNGHLSPEVAIIFGQYESDHTIRRFVDASRKESIDRLRVRAEARNAAANK